MFYQHPDSKGIGKWRIIIMVLFTIIMIFYGIIIVNNNLYNTILSDSDKQKAVASINADKAPIKVFDSLDERSNIYKLLDNSKNGSIHVFYSKKPYNIRTESKNYAITLNENVWNEYKNICMTWVNNVKNECRRFINYITYITKHLHT